MRTWSERQNLNDYLERKAESAVRGDYAVQNRLSEAEAEMEIRSWEQKGSEIVLFSRMGNHAKRVNVRCALWMMRAVFTISDMGPRRLCAEKYVTVMSTVPCCDVTTVLQHYMGSTSTPLRVARLCQIRETSFVALRNSTKSTLAHMCRSFDSSNSIIFVSRDFHS